MPNLRVEEYCPDTVQPFLKRGKNIRPMRVASEIILELSTAQDNVCPVWPHPWDHYPFQADGKTVWLRYADLDPEQRKQIRLALEYLKCRPGNRGKQPA